MMLTNKKVDYMYNAFDLMSKAFNNIGCEAGLMEFLQRNYMVVILNHYPPEKGATFMRVMVQGHVYRVEVS